MDPNFIHMDWERTIDGLALVAVFAVVIERALSVVFQSEVFIVQFDRAGLKEAIAVAVSVAACATWQLDVMGMLMPTPTTTWPGFIVTGALVAGGAKGSVKLFQDLLNLQNAAFKARHALTAEHEAAEAVELVENVRSAPTRTSAEIAKAKVAKAVKRVDEAATKAAVDGTTVPLETLASAHNALWNANALALSKRS